MLDLPTLVANEARDRGRLAVGLPLLMITPRSSITQMLELSNDTSIPTKNCMAVYS